MLTTLSLELSTFTWVVVTPKLNKLDQAKEGKGLVASTNSDSSDDLAFVIFSNIHELYVNGKSQVLQMVLISLDRWA